MSSEAATIAGLARRFRLLAERPNLLYPDSEERANRVLDDPVYAGWSVLDLLLVAGADETDRVCAQAVATLPKQTNKEAAAILELLGVLPAEYIVAIHRALPSETRAVSERDEVWAYRLAHAPPGVDTAEAELEALASSPRLVDTGGLAPGDRLDLERFVDGFLRRAVGLPNELTPEEERVAGQAEALARQAGFSDSGSRL